MFCRFCGSQLLDETSVFCSKCGAKLIIDNSNGNSNGNQRQVHAMNIERKEEFSIDKIKFIGVNLGFIITYFIGWLKFTNADINFVLSYIGIKRSVSPSFLFDIISGLKEVVEGSGKSLPIYWNLIYLLILIPLCGGAAILLCFIKQEKYSIYACKAGFILSAIACIGALALTLDANVGMKAGLLIAIGVTVLAKFGIEGYEGEIHSITKEHMLWKAKTSVMDNHILFNNARSNSTTSDKWICKHCGLENKSQTIFCIGCGTYK